ncbi:MAG: hypothetical protein GY816_20430 [Cytophagales bacterium]|nr:hypothetical protein [Cytophagales bacterium]
MIRVRKSDGLIVGQENGMQILNCTDMPRHQWIVESDKWEVAMNVNQCDFEPEILVRNDRVFLGVEQGVFVLDMNTGAIVSDVASISSVKWVEGGASSLVLFAAEDEVIALENLGQFLWRKNLSDIIEMTDIENDNLVITDISGNKYILSLLDGSDVKH